MSYLISLLPYRKVSSELAEYIVIVVRGEWRHMASRRSWIDAARYTFQDENIAFPLRSDFRILALEREPSFITAGLTANSLNVEQKGKYRSGGK